MSKITTHVLDTSLGRPAAGVHITLELMKSSGFKEIARGVTNDDGRVSDLIGDQSLVAGVYKITFETKDYFAASGRPAFYPSVPIIFEVGKAEEHYHVPLLLSPFGYSTYRGS
ncbi:MAG: hydroxyisourate hydrolase [Cyanobacteria bacterium REEB67]|nr:hydroxyisourate hydrolase [Cyanobacteria bacterium REEB67]